MTDIGKTTFQYDILVDIGCWGEKTTDPKGNITEKTFDKVGILWRVTSGGKPQYMNTTTTAQEKA